MRYWLTQQYPKERLPELYNIYLKDKFLARFKSRISVDDGISFYETGGVNRNGRSAIIGVGRVCGLVRHNQHPRVSPEDEGAERWEWEIPCKDIHFGKEIVLARVRQILSWSNGQRPRFPGGVREITAMQFDQIKGELSP